MIAALALLSLSACAGLETQRSASVTAADLQRAVGDDWRGTLTYRDYSPPFSDVVLAVEARVTALPDGISISLHYPSEPQADSVNQMLVSDFGARVDGALVVEVAEVGDTLIVSTTEACEDDNRPAICTHDYTFGQSGMIWVKRVQFDGEAPITRNTYAFNR
jgi:hypothetical protein